MEFQDVVRRRRMVRNYDPDRAVPAAVRERLLANAVRAPSAGFTQGSAFLVLERPEERAAFWAVTSDAGPPDPWLTGMQRAPLLIVPLSHRQAAEYTPIGAVSVGYPAPDRRSPSLRRGRRPMVDVVHHGAW